MPDLEPCVLVVEDEPALLEVIGGFLRHMGYSALLAATANDAERMSRKHCGHIDLLITDLELPDQLGTEVARSLLSHRPDMKVLFMTAGGLWCNPRKYGPRPEPLLEKPFGLKEFRQIIGAILEASR